MTSHTETLNCNTYRDALVDHLVNHKFSDISNDDHDGSSSKRVWKDFCYFWYCTTTSNNKATIQGNIMCLHLLSSKVIYRNGPNGQGCKKSCKKCLIWVLLPQGNLSAYTNTTYFWKPSKSYALTGMVQTTKIFGLFRVFIEQLFKTPNVVTF